MSSVTMPQQMIYYLISTSTHTTPMYPLLIRLSPVRSCYLHKESHPFWSLYPPNTFLGKHCIESTSTSCNYGPHHVDVRIQDIKQRVFLINNLIRVLIAPFQLINKSSFSFEFYIVISCSREGSVASEDAKDGAAQVFQSIGKCSQSTFRSVNEISSVSDKSSGLATIDMVYDLCSFLFRLFKLRIC